MGACEDAPCCGCCGMCSECGGYYTKDSSCGCSGGDEFIDRDDPFFEDYEYDDE